MSDTEHELQELEASFPELSGRAFSAAREQALAAGLSVLEADSGMIYRVFPDGNRQPVKEIPAPLPVHRGARLRLR